MPQIVFITGAARGLGLALCCRYLELGDTVLACIRGETAAGLDDLKNAFPDKLKILPGIDVEQEGMEQGLAKAAKAAAGGIDLLINNAAVNLDDKAPLEQLSMEDALRTFSINTLGPLRVTRALLPLLKDGGKIVNISSEAASNATNFREDTYAYCMSKAALNRASTLLQKKVEPRGMTVIVMQPGWMQTDMGGSGADYTPAFAAEHIAQVIADTNSFAHVDLMGRPCQW